MNKETNQVAKRGPGKPRKEPPKDALTVIKQATATGASKRGVAMALGAHVETLNKWLDESPELKEAFEQGRETERQTLHNVLYDCAVGGQGKDSLIAAMFLLKARHGYREGEQATEANRVSVTFNIPAAMPLDKFTVIENEPDPRAKRISAAPIKRA